jgi:F-type H+-transporting ATPase subunit delta
MAGRYALALFELAKESNTTDQIAADLQTFSALIAESDDMRRFLRSPVFSADEQIAALTAILNQAGIAGTAANFLKLVAQKRRLFAVGDMIRDYNALNDAEKGISRAEVTVAEPLKDAHVAALKEALHALAGGTTVEIATKVDPSILGGLIVKYGSRMVDGSLKTKLDMIRTRMKEVG